MTDQPRSTPSKVWNFFVFQIVWGVCVLGAAAGEPLLATTAGFALLPLDLLPGPQSERVKSVRVALVAGFTGLVVDSGLRAAGVVAFPAAALPDGWPTWLAPPWIVCLWFALGALVPSSLGWLGRLPLALTALVAGAAGAISFWSGERLGATLVPMGPTTLGLLALEYALVVPILFRVAGPAASGPVVH